MRRRYRDEGISGLLARYGKNATKTIVSDEYFDYFKNLYLIEGAPSFYSCYELTFGYAARTYGVNKKDFPSHMSFKRRLEREIPKQSIYLAHFGQSAWNRKYGSYIDRDYSKVICGKIWVSDHAQIDGLDGFFNVIILIPILFFNHSIMRQMLLDCLKMSLSITAKIIVQKILPVAELIEFRLKQTNQRQPQCLMN